MGFSSQLLAIESAPILFLYRHQGLAEEWHVGVLCIGADHHLPDSSKSDAAGAPSKSGNFISQASAK